MEPTGWPLPSAERWPVSAITAGWKWPAGALRHPQQNEVANSSDVPLSLTTGKMLVRMCFVRLVASIWAQYKLRYAFRS